MTFVQIAYFDWLLGKHKGKFSKSNIQNITSLGRGTNNRVFWSDMNSGYNLKSGNWIFLLSHMGYLNFIQCL